MLIFKVLFNICVLYQLVHLTMWCDGLDLFDQSFAARQLTQDASPLSEFPFSTGSTAPAI